MHFLICDVFSDLFLFFFAADVCLTLFCLDISLICLANYLMISYNYQFFKDLLIHAVFILVCMTAAKLIIFGTITVWVLRFSVPHNCIIYALK